MGCVHVHISLEMDISYATSDSLLYMNTYCFCSCLSLNGPPLKQKRIAPRHEGTVHVVPVHACTAFKSTSSSAKSGLSVYIYTCSCISYTLAPI